MTAIGNSAAELEKLNRILENTSDFLGSFVKTMQMTYNIFNSLIGPVQQYETVMYNLARNTGMTYRQTLELNSAIEKLTHSTVFAQNEIISLFNEVQKGAGTASVSFERFGETLKKVSREFGSQADAVMNALQKLAAQDKDIRNMLYGEGSARGLNQTQQLIIAMNKGGLEAAMALKRLQSPGQSPLSEWNRLSQTEAELRAQNMRTGYRAGQEGAEYIRNARGWLRRLSRGGEAFAGSGLVPTALGFGAAAGVAGGGEGAGGMGGAGGGFGIPGGGGGAMSAGVVNIQANQVNVSGGRGRGGGLLGLPGIPGLPGGGGGGGGEGGGGLAGMFSRIAGVIAGIIPLQRSSATALGRRIGEAEALGEEVGLWDQIRYRMSMANPFTGGAARRAREETLENVRKGEAEANDPVTQLLRFMQESPASLEQMTKTSKAMLNATTQQLQVLQRMGMPTEQIRELSMKAAEHSARIVAETQAEMERYIQQYIKTQQAEGRKITRQQAESELLAADELYQSYYQSLQAAQAQTVELRRQGQYAAYITSQTQARTKYEENILKLIQQGGASILVQRQRLQELIAVQKKGYVEALATYKMAEEAYRRGEIGIDALMEEHSKVTEAGAQAYASIMKQFELQEPTELRLMGTAFRAREAMMTAFGTTNEERRRMEALEALRQVSILDNFINVQLPQAFENLGTVTARVKVSPPQTPVVPGQPQELAPASQREYLRNVDEFKKQDREFRNYLRSAKAKEDYEEWKKSQGFWTRHFGDTSFNRFLEEQKAHKMPTPPKEPKDRTGWIANVEARKQMRGDQAPVIQPVEKWVEATHKFRVGSEAIAKATESALQPLQKFAELMRSLSTPLFTTGMESYASTLEYQIDLVRTLPASAATQIAVLSKGLELSKRQYSEAVANYQKFMAEAGGKETDIALMWKREAQKAGSSMARYFMELSGGLQGRLEAEFDKFNTNIEEALMPRAADLARARAAGVLPEQAASPYLYGRMLKPGEVGWSAFYRSPEWFARGMHPLEGGAMPAFLGGAEAQLPTLERVYAKAGREALMDPETQRMYQEQAQRSVQAGAAGGSGLDARTMKQIMDSVFHGAEPIKVVIAGKEVVAGSALPPAAQHNL